MTTQPDIEKKCIWIYKTENCEYDTLCGRTFIVNSTDIDYIYCPYCGEKIEEIKENQEQPF
jgi:DNA-directed RNA polymerase subunit RPC12/RpoP